MPCLKRPPAYIQATALCGSAGWLVIISLPDRSKLALEIRPTRMARISLSSLSLEILHYFGGYYDYMCFAAALLVHIIKGTIKGDKNEHALEFVAE